MQLDLERDDLMALLQRASAMAAHRFLDTERSALGPKLPTEDVRRLFAEPLPEDGMSWQALLAKVESEVFANSMRSTSPDFYGLVTSCGNPYGIAGELLAAGLNQVVVRENVAPAATAVEAQVLRWLAQFIGTPHEHGGVMVSGGSAANLVGLMAARCAKGPPDLADKGLSAAPPMTVYTSTGAHLCIDKAVDILGLGREQLRKIPVAEEDFRIRLDRLRAAILEDRERGARPLAIVAQGGGVNTGAVDDLNALADLCAEQDMWLHVDGAYGAPAAGTESGRPLFAGLERVDS
ncbi:MAG: aminotransferase class I/II-fold pyridoxal phosphate-dependent enzyme, partial [Acidobacteriota bacterium]